MSDERIKQKIRKLLELGRQSTFPNEAASAKNQALTLLRRHNLSEKDLYPELPVRSKVVITPEEIYANQIIDLLIYKKRMEEFDKREKARALAKNKQHKVMTAYVIIGILILASAVVSLFFGAKG